MTTTQIQRAELLLAVKENAGGAGIKLLRDVLMDLDRAEDRIKALEEAANAYMAKRPDPHCSRCTEGGSGVERYVQCELHGVLNPNW